MSRTNYLHLFQFLLRVNVIEGVLIVLSRFKLKKLFSKAQTKTQAQADAEIK